MNDRVILRHIPFGKKNLPLIAVTILLVIGTIGLFGYGAVKISHIVSEKMLRENAQAKASIWAGTLLESVDDFPAMMAGAPPSEQTRRLLNDASQIGEFYRFRIWSKTGRLVFTSERIHSPEEPLPLSQRYGQQIADSITDGSSFTRVFSGYEPANMESYAETFVPVIRNRDVIAVLDVYQDQTGDKNFYEKYFFLIGGPLALAILIGGWFFLFRIYSKMIDYRVGEIRALSLAYNDSLTDIPNRGRLKDFAEKALARTRHNKQQVAVLLIDLDRFKEINDTFGHISGDEVLRVAATRMRSAIREEDMVARLGGDEFVVLQLGMAQPASAASLANRLLKSISEPYNVGGIEIAGGGSIGAAIAPVDAVEWEELLRCADAALYNAKAEGGNLVRFFQSGMDAVFQQSGQIESDRR